MSNRNVLFILLVTCTAFSSGVLADPGVLCASTVDSNVVGCNCPNTCTCKNCKQISNVGSCETKVACSIKPVLAEKAEPYDVKITMTNTRTDKVIYSGDVDKHSFSFELDKFGECINWEDPNNQRHKMCKVLDLLIHIYEVNPYKSKEK